MRRSAFVNLPVRTLQFGFFRQIHSAVRVAIKQITGSLKGTTNITSQSMFNLFEREIAFEMRQNIVNATTHLYKALREKVNVPYPPASRPGQPPRKRTGKGRNAIRRGLVRNTNFNVEQMIYLDSSGHYMALLEAGVYVNVYGSGHFVWVDPRPWMEPTLNQEYRTLERLLTKGYK